MGQDLRMWLRLMLLVCKPWQQRKNSEVIFLIVFVVYLTQPS